MPLYIASIPLEHLLPIQADPLHRTHLDRLAALPNLPPIKAVLYEETEDSNPTYLLADGHNRSYLAALRGEETILGKVAIDDSGIVDLDASSSIGLFTLDAFHSRYRSMWRRQIEAAGITDIASLPVTSDGEPRQEQSGCTPGLISRLLFGAIE